MNRRQLLIGATAALGVEATGVGLIALGNRMDAENKAKKPDAFRKAVMPGVERLWDDVYSQPITAEQMREHCLRICAEIWPKVYG